MLPTCRVQVGLTIFLIFNFLSSSVAYLNTERKRIIKRPSVIKDRPQEPASRAAAKDMLPLRSNLE